MINKVPFSSFDFIHKKIKSEILKDFNDVYDDNWFICGKKLNSFEQLYANFCGTKYSVGLSNGLDAIYLALKCLEVGKNDEVIVPSNTFIATVLAIVSLDATPVFVEPDLKTYNIDAKKIENAITNRTKVIIPVHLYGQVCEMDEIMSVANKYSIHVLEDNAQAHGAMYKDNVSGSFGIINATSFYPGKNLGALGDGGAITTNNEFYYNQIKNLRNYGSNIKYKHDIVGYNMRLDELQAAFLITKLKYLQEWNNLRNLAANYYKELLSDVKEIYLPYTSSNSTHTYHLFVIRTNYRNELMKYLESKGIGVLIHYPIPPHLQKALSFLNYKVGDFPIAEELSNTMLSLPMWPGITKNDIELVCNEIKSFFNEQ
jgi:dTDP-4-amino-4,6-dideoxygalactose transaminase